MVFHVQVTSRRQCPPLQPAADVSNCQCNLQLALAEVVELCVFLWMTAGLKVVIRVLGLHRPLTVEVAIYRRQVLAPKRRTEYTYWWDPACVPDV